MSVCTFIASELPLTEVVPVQDYPLEINIDDGTIYMFMSNALILVIAIIGSFSIVKKTVSEIIFGERSLAKEIAGTIFVMVIMVLCTAMLVNSAYNPFLYFRF